MLFYNEDWMHFIWTRYNAGIEITEENLKEYVYSFKGTQITDFIMNVNGSVSNADSKVFETFAQKYLVKEENGIKVDYTETFAKLAYDVIVNKKIDMYAVWADTCRETGINPWISIRMNDCHGNQAETEIRKTSFTEKNPQYHIAAYRKGNGYFDKCHDYSHAEIRNRMLSYIDEMLSRYDVYGLELDWTREIIMFSPGFEAQGREIVTELVGKIYDILKKYEKKYLHPIKLALLMPSLPQAIYELGIDIWSFIDKVDYISIISRWETTDTDMPIELWRQLLKGKDVKFGCGQQLLIKPYRGYKPTVTSVKAAFGQAMANLSRGADYVYLYNYMDMGEYEGAIKEWIYDESIRNDSNRTFLFSNIGKTETLIKQNRSHIVTYNDFDSCLDNIKSMLPVKVGKNYGYRRIKIPVGEIPEGANVKLILGTDVPVEAGNMSVYVNSAKCEFSGKTAPNDTYDKEAYSFEIKENRFKIMIAEIQIKQNCNLEYVEVEVLPQK